MSYSDQNNKFNIEYLDRLNFEVMEEHIDMQIQVKMLSTFESKIVFINNVKPKVMKVGDKYLVHCNKLIIHKDYTKPIYSTVDEAKSFIDELKKELRKMFQDKVKIIKENKRREYWLCRNKALPWKRKRFSYNHWD